MTQFVEEELEQVRDELIAGLDPRCPRCFSDLHRKDVEEDDGQVVFFMCFLCDRYVLQAD